METEFVWANDYDTNYCLCARRGKTARFGGPLYPAPIATETLERLPEVLVHEKCKLYTLQMRKGWANDTERGKYIVSYWFLGEDYLVEKTAPTLAQAVTDMYIHLIKESLI